MKLFRVITEYESRAKNASPGELMRMEKYIAANSIEDVWAETYLDRMDQGVDVIAIIEHAPSVQVLTSDGHQSGLSTGKIEGHMENKKDSAAIPQQDGAQDKEGE